MRDAYNNPHLDHARKVWNDKWSDQHAQWEPPVVGYGAQPLKNGYLSCYEQHATQGNHVRVFAVVEGSDRALAISYDAASKTLDMQDPTGIMTNETKLNHEILEQDAIDVAENPLSKPQSSHAAAYRANKGTGQERTR